MDEDFFDEYYEDEDIIFESPDHNSYPLFPRPNQ